MVEAYIDSELSKLESSILKWMVGVAFIQTVLLLAIVFSIIKFLH